MPRQQLTDNKEHPFSLEFGYKQFQNHPSIFAVKSVLQGQQAALITGFAHPGSHVASQDVHHVPLRGKKASGKPGFQERFPGKKSHPTTPLEHTKWLLPGEMQHHVLSCQERKLHSIPPPSHCLPCGVVLAQETDLLFY